MEEDPGSPWARSVKEAPRDHLAHHIEACLELYRCFMLNYATDSDSDDKCISAEKVLSEFGRLKIWTEQTGAILRGNGSLEDQLQADTALLADVTDIFQQMTIQLAEAIALQSKQNVEDSTPDQDAASNFASDSECSVDGLRPDELRTGQRPKISKLKLTLLHLFEQIRLLYHYSAIFRRPRLGGRYLHFDSKKTEPSVPYYEFSHVRQKLDEWRDDRAAVTRSDCNVNSQASGGLSGPATGSISESDRDILCLRLAAANNRRREQLMYWGDHPFSGANPHLENQSMLVEMHTEPHSQREDASENLSRRSHLTVRTFSSVARSAIFETETEFGPSRTVYADSAADLGRTAKKFPKVPVDANSATSFECPYCRMSLDSLQMCDRNTWKRHIFRDLRPYVCTFAKCGNPDKLYATRREWIYHEMQMHRRKWDCRLCHGMFTSQQHMSAHLASFHVGEWEKNQISALIQVSDRPLDESTPQRCPFCSETDTLRKMMVHVAGHLEELALFTLPRDGSTEPPEEESLGALSSLDSQDDMSDEDMIDLRPKALSRRTLEASQPIGSRLQRSLDAVRELRERWSHTSSFATASSPGNDLTPLTTPLPRPGSPVLNTLSDGPDAIPLEFPCSECHRVFDQLHKLKHHMRYHLRPHECPHPGCNMRFGTKTHLDRHMNDRHLKQSQYYYCPVAGCAYSSAGARAFPRKDNLRRHLQRMHKLDPDLEPVTEDTGA